VSGDTVSSPCMCAKWHDYQVVGLINPSYWLAMWNLHVCVWHSKAYENIF